MQPGDTVQILQTDMAILRHGEEPNPGVPHWIYAVVFDTLKNDAGKITAAHVEVNHPANFQHGQRLLVSRKNIRTIEDLQSLHAAHPEAKTEKLDFNRHDHKELNNLRAAIERCKPQEEAA